MITNRAHSGLSEALPAVLAGIRAAAPGIDATARVPPELLSHLERAGLFDLLTPAEAGGRHVPLPTVFDTYERLGRVDGSVALRVWNGNFGFLGTLLGSAGRDELWGDGDHNSDSNRNSDRNRDHNDGASSSDARPRFANAGQPGRAHRIADGWRVEGRWPLVTGADTADWFVFGALVDEGALAGTILRVPLRADQVEVQGDRGGTGLRGAGNRVVVATAAEVPDRLVSTMRPAPGEAPDPGFAPLLLVAPGISAVTLGIARGALDLAADQLRTDAQRGADPVRRMRLARSDAGLRGALAGLLRSVEPVEERRSADQAVPDADRARVLASMYFAAEVSSEALTTAAALCGSAALEQGSPLERRLRDGAAALRHGNQSDTRYPAAGADLIAEVPRPE